MKRIIYSAILFFFLLNSKISAQGFESSAFGAPVLRYTSLAGQSAFIAGGRFGWIINKSIVLGGGLYGLISNVSTGYKDNPSGQNVMLGMNFGGLELEYIFFPESFIHGSIDMLFAGGGTYYSVQNTNVPHSSYFSQDLLLWEPSINIEINVLPWLHTDLNYSYRIITSYPANYNISTRDLEGSSIGLVLKFGKY